MSSLARLQNQRAEPRIRVRWHAEVFIEGQGVHRGFIKEISMSGTGFFLQKNVPMTKSIRLRIYMPPFTSSSVPYTMDVNAKVLHTVLDSEESLFRTGVIFSQFIVPGDKRLLQKYIELLPCY